MIPKLIIPVFILCSNYLLTTVADDVFKVPLEVRAKNRPERIVDKSDDPDLRSLKDIQDKFFNIVGNASMNKEYKNFKQLLHLVDSDAGLELGRLLFRGVMIGYGKDNSNDLLSEFFDDFQYRLSPDLADALMDYKDFIKTIDLKMIPLTIQTLFRKDGLGNSLAHMPLGQLIDLVQPEASKYGIDIKGVINGILGKGGDSTFPDLVKRALNSFNVSALLDSIPKSLSATDTNQLKDVANEIKRDKKNPAIMLFKPFISNFLKENKIDLDPDAVIQVLTPFVSPILQSFLPSTSKKDGKANGNIDFAQLLPMLLGSLGNSNDSKTQGANILKSVMSMLGGLGGGKDNDAIGNLLKMASGLLQSSTKDKKPKNSKEAEVESVSVKKPTSKKIEDDSKANLDAAKDDQDNNKRKAEALGKLFTPEVVEQVKSKMRNFDADLSFLMPMLSMLGGLGGTDGKKDDSMANLLNLASSLLGGKTQSKDGSDQKPNVMDSLMPMLSMLGNLGGKDGKKDDSMANLINLASSLLGGKKQSKDGSDQKPNVMDSLMPMLSMLGNLGGKDGKKDDEDDSKVNLDAAKDILDKTKRKTEALGKLFTPEVVEQVKSKMGNFDADLSFLMPMLSMLGNLGGKDGKKDDSMANLLNLASSLLGGKTQSKDGSDQKPNVIDSLMPMLSMLGNLGGKDGKKDDSMANLINLASSMLGGKKQAKDGSDQKPNAMDSLMPMLSMLGNLGGKDGKKDDSMANLINLASGIMGDKKQSKDGSNEKPNVMDSLMPILSLLGNAGGTADQKQNVLNNILNLIPGAVSTDKNGKKRLNYAVILEYVGTVMTSLGTEGGNEARSMMETVIGMMGKDGKNGDWKEAMKSHPRYKKAQENVAKVLEVASELEKENYEPDPLSFLPSLEKFIVLEQSNKIFLVKVRESFAVSKAMITIKFKNMNEFEKIVGDYLKQYNKNINAHVLLEPLRLPEEQFEAYISTLTKEGILSSPIITTTGAELAKTLTENGLYVKIGKIWKEQMEPLFAQVGLQGITLNNFPKLLGPMVPIVVAAYNIPHSITSLLEPLQYSLKDTVDWYFQSIEELKKLPKSELRDLYAESFYDQVIAPLKSIWQLRKLSKSSPACLPRATCDLVSKVPKSNFVELMVTRIGSIIYGGYVAEGEQQYELFLQTILASITTKDCKEFFPYECPTPSAPKGDVEDADSKTKDAKAKPKHTEL